MTKIAILGDLHLGYKKSDPFYWSYFLKFFDNIFVPYLETNNIDTIIQLGDFFDNRRSLELDTIYKTKKLVLDKLKNKNIHILVGNHCVYYKDSNLINSPNLVLGEYSNINTYSECTSINIDGVKIDLIPWIHLNNYESTLNFIKSSKSQIACGHLEVNGAMLFPGHTLTQGTDPNIFSKYKKVLSGHIHFKSIYQNIHYTGIPYELNFGDENAVRGFTILDTDTLKTKFIKNPYQLFKTIYYDINTDLHNVDDYKDAIIKLIVRKIDSNQDFDDYVDKLQSVAHSVKISESSNRVVNTESFSDDTMIDSSALELFEEYLSGVDVGDNHESIMSIIKDIYQKVL